MKKVTFILVAGVLLLTVAVVFIAPTVSLQPTAMRAARAAMMAMVALATTATALFTLLLFPAVPLRSSAVLFGDVVSFPELIDLVCARLC